MSEVDDKQIVPGDVVHLAIGDIIPGDTRLFKVEDMTTNESSLTGESLPVLKNVATVSKDYSLPQYLTNIAFMGTSIASGSGEGIVIATGKNTFFGEKQPI
jgi:Mg2+-importing ATPase